MDDSSCSSSSDSCSSSMWKGDRVAMCSVANREPVSPIARVRSSPLPPHGRHRQGDKLVSNTRGVACTRDSGFDYSAFRHLLPSSQAVEGDGLQNHITHRGFESHLGIQFMTLKDDNYIETKDGNKIRFDVTYDTTCALFVAVAWSGNLAGDGESEADAVAFLKKIVAHRERRYGSWSDYVRFREHREM